MSGTASRAASDFHHRGHLKCSPHAFWMLHTLKCRLLLWKWLNMIILNLSKSVAWYQKYMHTKACVAMGNTPRAWGQVKMKFTLYFGGSAIFWLNDIIIIYCPSWRLCKNWWPVISGMKHCGMFPTSAYIPGKSTETWIHHVITHTQEAVENQSYTWDFLDAEGASDSTSRDITKASKWHVLGDTLAMDQLHARWQKKLQPHPKEIFCRGI
jgi:hypothetical protein